MNLENYFRHFSHIPACLALGHTKTMNLHFILALPPLASHIHARLFLVLLIWPLSRTSSICTYVGFELICFHPHFLFSLYSTDSLLFRITKPPKQHIPFTDGNLPHHLHATALLINYSPPAPSGVVSEFLKCYLLKLPYVCSLFKADMQSNWEEMKNAMYHETYDYDYMPALYGKMLSQGGESSSDENN